MVAIIDSGIANVRSVANAFAAVGVQAMVTCEPAAIRTAERLVLPGVGSFADGMRNLHGRGLTGLLNEGVRARRKPVLGICLGMQLFTEWGLEYGEHRGLGWIEGQTVPFEFDGPPQRVPHVGWNDCTVVRPHPLFAGIPERADFYFVHSFHVRPQAREVVTATCDYGKNFVAAIAHDNIVGVQFHPEKSHRWGLVLLKNFASWKPEGN